MGRRRRAPRVTLLLPLAVSVLAVLSLLADAAEAARIRWTTPGSYRLRAVTVDDIPLDPEASVSGQNHYGRHRLRLDPTLDAGDVLVHLQLDVLTGQIWGDTYAVGAEYVERRHGDPEEPLDGWTTVEPRMLWLEWRLPWLTLRAGQLGDQWGMGLLASDGQDPPAPRSPLGTPEPARWVERFGDPTNGDLVDRVQLEVAPFRSLTRGWLGDLVLAGGADFVYQDEHASFLDGDSGYRFHGQLFYPGERAFLGFYGLHRRQTDVDGDRFVRTALDMTGRVRAPLYEFDAELRLEGEVLYIFGDTNRVQPVDAPDGVELRQFGWAARGEISWLCPRIAVALETGHASGDADPTDGTERALTLDPDHRVGVVLFDDALRFISLRAAERLADPERVGVAPEGAERLPTDGAVRNAFYIAPAATWRPGAWRLTLGTLVAWAAEPFLDPVATLEAGGTSRSHRNLDARHFYGWETDLRIHRDFVVPGVAHVAVGAEGGLLVVGRALEGPGDAPTIGKVTARLDVWW